jgi:cytochrome c biogenesis protein CcmG, thiol:disulfide interchange protein DsbE
MNRFLLPLAVFIVLAVFLAIGLSLNPREVPSPLIGKAAPAFRLPQLRDPKKDLSRDEMLGQVWLLNVWASWCTPCLEEHPLLVELGKNKIVPIVGLNYKDGRDAALKWLSKNGDPYDQIVTDPDGRIGIDYGVYGVPETYLIDRQGFIRYKHIGPLTPAVLQGTILPLVRSLQA